MRPLVLCSMLLVAGCVNGSSSYPYYANGPHPLYVPPPLVHSCIATEAVTGG